MEITRTADADTNFGGTTPTLSSSTPAAATTERSEDPDMTLRPDIAAWLGDPPDPPLDADQADRITDLIDTLADRWPDPDASNELEAAMYGAVQIVLGAVTLETFAENHLRALYAEREAMAALHGAVLASATGARSPLPGSEIDLINRARLSRTTVRRIIGR